MIWPADYHMHTPLCQHATGQPSEYAAQALRLGLSEIGFSDHSPMRRDDFDEWRMKLAQLDEYVEDVRRAQKDFPNLITKLGLEVDYLPEEEAWVRELAARHPWDYFIGSVHYVSGGWDIDNPAKLSRWTGLDVFEVWTDYFERLTLAAASGLFNIIGHADLPKKFGHRADRDCTPLHERLLNAALKGNTALELNTAGLRKDCREIYPALPLVRLAAQKKVPITFGSDAHSPAEVGMNFAEAVQLARQAGFTQWCRWTQRRPEMASL
ncbi:MAG: histidinol-phosphatase HisJ family protein [Verrucomicrobia bacterium]|nr:histidinol-phosphatase HisJ family protein [Verrucomicrobiota bacterium]